ncbi:MAG: hypothetical protein LBL58_02630 [Tannerellaceae bacterium]|jgi:hypothetical protein|nr:hypothetical protein [Tannerellaceae bacterium]
MVERYLQIETLDFVLLGKFNPSIVQPSWLALKNLISTTEAENATIIIIHQDIAQYNIGDWVTIEVTRDHCSLKTSKQNYFAPLQDLVVGIFKYLNETPVRALGINFTYELSLLDAEQYYSFGNKLVPLVSWNSVLNDSRLFNLQIIEEKRDKKDHQKRIVTVSPSPLEYKISFGISIQVNNHYDLPENKTSSDAMKLLNEHYSKDFKDSKNILVNIIETSINI